jgi:GT2 family glycosyltransferase
LPDGELPFCSVIVPTRGRPAQLARCVAALERLDYPHDRFEVIVVDDVDGEGPATARNRGARRARGELLAFTDDDCRPGDDWLRALVDRWAAGRDVAVGGRTTNGLPDDAFAAASQTIVDLVYAHSNAGGEARFFASNNLAVPAAGFAALGGFDEVFRASEDRDFCARWLASGGRLAFAPAAVVAHAPRLTLARFCRRHFEYGRGAYRYHRSRPVGMAASIRAELPFHSRSLRLLGPVLSSAGGRRAAPLVGLLALWQVANAVGFVSEAVRTRAGRAPRSCSTRPARPPCTPPRASDS